MRLSKKAFALASGLLWGGCLLLVGLINLAAPTYGVDFLRGMGSVYPGFYHVRTVPDAFLGLLYGFVDGAIAGWLFGWLYNLLARPRQESAAAQFNRAA